MSSELASLQLLSISELCRLLNRSRSSIYRDVSAGHLPKPVKIGASTRFRVREVEAALQRAADSPETS